MRVTDIRWLVGRLAPMVAVASALAAHPAAADDLDDRIAALEHRARVLRTELQRLNDIDAIENLQNAYGYYVDKRLWDEVADLFTADARYELAQRGVFIGRERIRHILGVFGGPGTEHGRLFNHIQLQPLIHVAPDGKTANARVRAVAQGGSHGDDGSGIWGEGVYEMGYAKQDDGWKIASLHFYITMYTPYADGWGKSALPTELWRVREGFEPDEPPTEIYDFYPAVHIPPYHYRHPVTGE